MKKNMIKMLMMLVFASLVLSSCSVQYRERHRRDGHERDRDGRDHRDNRGYNGYHYKAF